jgi:hypothetical protein
MEIQSLRLLVTDADVAVLAAQLVQQGGELEELQVRLTPEGVVVSGKYPTSFMRVPFETTWQVTAQGPEVRVTLAAVRVAGLPGNMLRGVLMKMVRDSLASRPGVRVEEDHLAIDVGEAVRPHGMEVRVHFVAVRMSVGSALIEAAELPG